MTYLTKIEKMENKEPQSIQKISANSIPNHTQAIKSLTLTVEKAINSVDADDVVLKLIRCQASIEALVNDKHWRESIKPIEHTTLTGKELHSFFLEEYQKMNGAIIENNDWSKCVSTIADLIANGKPMIMYGKTGVGKTSIMQSFGRIFSILQNPNHKPFITKRATELVDEFKKGQDVNSIYSQPLNIGFKKDAGLFIDDIGTEEQGVSFGSKSDVIGDLILAIYARHGMSGRVSYSTNLSARDLKDRYGEREYGRLMEMCTVVIYPESIPNFRFE